MHITAGIAYLPLTAYVAASRPSGPQDDDGLWDSPLYGVPEYSLRRDVQLMQVVGNSMDDGSPRSIPHGSIVLVDQHDLNIHHTRRGYVYVFITPEGAQVAKIFDLYKGRYALLSLNPDVPPIVDFRRAGYEPVGLVYALRLSATKVKLIGAI